MTRTHALLLFAFSGAARAGAGATSVPLSAPPTCVPGSPSAALLIGVDDYTSPELPDLHQSGAEVALVAQALTHTASYPERAVTVLRSQGDAAHQPTSGSARAALEGLARGGPYGTVLVYLSGFAVPSEVGLRFLTADAVPSAVSASGLGLDEITGALAALPACHVALVLDGGPRASASSSTPTGLAPGVPMLASARWDEIPLEAPQGSVSFASLFAEGLGGLADQAPRDGALTLDELLATVRSGMAQAGIRHTPTLSCLDCDGTWPLISTLRPAR